MAQYLANAVQAVALNTPVIFSASIPCTRGFVNHENETGIFQISYRDNCGNPCNRYAQFDIMFHANIAIPTGGTVGPIAMAITVNGEPRLASRAIFTPAAVDEYGNVTCPATIRVPRGCCYTIAVEPVTASNDPTVTPAPVVNVQNASISITRTA